MKLGIKEHTWVLPLDVGERVLTMSMVDVSPKLCASNQSLQSSFLMAFQVKWHAPSSVVVVSNSVIRYIFSLFNT